jgi:hypothetical protein
MISQLITNVIGGAAVDVGTIGTGMLLLAVAVLSHRFGVRAATLGNRRNRPPTVSYLGSDGKKVTKAEFYRQSREFYKNFDERGYQQWLKQNSGHTPKTAKTNYQKKPASGKKFKPNGIGAYIKSNAQATKNAGFSRPVRNLSARYSSQKRETMKQFEKRFQESGKLAMKMPKHLQKQVERDYQKSYQPLKSPLKQFKDRTGYSLR